MDTLNLNASMYKDRWTDTDMIAYKMLKPIFEKHKFDDKNYYELLCQKKNDLAGNLSQGLNVLLLKDYKNFIVEEKGKKILFGASSIEITLKDVIKHFGEQQSEEEYGKFLKEKSIEMLIIMAKLDTEGRDLLHFP